MTTNEEAEQARWIEGRKKLREPLPKSYISKLAKETRAQIDERKAQGNKVAIRCAVCGGWHHKDAIHLEYAGHAAITDRLLDADPEWWWEPCAWTNDNGEDGLPVFDATGGLWIRLHVCGRTMLGYGHADMKGNQSAGDRVKEVIGDALRNAGMRVGIGLELWHKGDLHEDESSQPGAPPQPDAPAAATKPKRATKTDPPPESEPPAAHQEAKPVTLMDVLKAFQGAYTEQELMAAGAYAKSLPEKDKATAKKAYATRLADVRLRANLLGVIATVMSDDQKAQAVVDFCGARLNVVLKKKTDIQALDTDELRKIAAWLGHLPEPEVAS